MFARLLKHQLKSTYKEFIVLYAILIVSGFFVGLFTGMRAETLLIISLCVFVFSILGVIIFFMISFFKICATSMFGKRGYLTFSIPVSVHQLILSKVLTMSIYALGLAISFFISFALIFIFISPSIAVEIFSVIGELMDVFNGYNPFIGVLVISDSIISFFYSVLLIMFCFTLANCSQSKKGRTALAIAYYIIIGMVVSIATSLPFFNFVIATDINGSLFVSSMYKIAFDGIECVPVLDLTSYLIHILGAVGFYCGTVYLMNHKLELE